MDSGREKYDKIVEILRRSKPTINDQEAFSERILHNLRREKHNRGLIDRLSDLFFGWVYVGWVRRSLVAVSFAILLMFIYQQSVILHRINAIDRLTVFTSSQLMPDVNDKLDTKLLFKRASLILPAKRGELSDRQVDQLIKSFNELQVKYKDILKIIEEDPDLKSYIEKKLNQKDREKLKL
jgi:DNA gyrase/topoisomerase IV subunit A